jgi:hypothetical protein
MAKTIVIKSSSTAPSALPGHRGMPLQVAPVYGIWAKVIKRNSGNDKDKKTSGNTVDVETAEGYRITNIPVLSKEWVTLEKTDKGKILGERDLPPENSLVFIIMTSGNIDSAFIIGSGFITSYDKHTEEFLTPDKELEKLTNLEGNWTKKYDKETGDLEVVGTDDDDKTLTITIKKSEKKIQLTDWNENDILIDGDGIVVKDTKGNTTTWNASGINTEDKNGNKIIKDSSGIKIEDKNGQKVEMASGGITVHSTTKITITCPAGISVVTSDSVTWQPNIVPYCPFGFSHGGPSAGIVLLKGS